MGLKKQKYGGAEGVFGDFKKIDVIGLQVFGGDTGQSIIVLKMSYIRAREKADSLKLRLKGLDLSGKSLNTIFEGRNFQFYNCIK